MSLSEELGRILHSWLSQAGLIWFQHTTGYVFYGYSYQMVSKPQFHLPSSFYHTQDHCLELGETQRRGKGACSQRAPSLYGENRQGERQLFCTKCWKGDEHQRGASNPIWGFGEGFPEVVTSNPNLIGQICGSHFDKSHMEYFVGGRRIAESGGVARGT